MTLLVILMLVILACALGGVGLAYDGRHRWGARLGAAEAVGSGPYRGGTSRPWLQRNVPASAAISGIFSFLWGPLTFLVFAPAGLLLCLAPVNHELGPLVILSDLLVSLNGLILPFGLVLVSSSLLGNRPGAGYDTRRVAIWSLVHHLAVIGSFSLRWLCSEHFSSDDSVFLFVLALIPCLFGLGHAALLYYAGDKVERIQRAMGLLELPEVEGIPTMETGSGAVFPQPPAGAV